VVVFQCAIAQEVINVPASSTIKALSLPSLLTPLKYKFTIVTSYFRLDNERTNAIELESTLLMLRSFLRLLAHCNNEQQITYDVSITIFQIDYNDSQSSIFPPTQKELRNNLLDLKAKIIPVSLDTNSTGRCVLVREYATYCL
jgi:hypothetical protein